MLEASTECINVTPEKGSRHRSREDRHTADAIERKRQQNRLAQRTYRYNQKQRLRALEGAVAQASNNFLPSLPTSTNFVAENPAHDDSIWNLSATENPQANSGITAINQHSHLTDISSDKIAFNPTSELFTDSETRPSLGRTALHRAVCIGNEAIIRLLLQQGADIERQDHNGQTALHTAVESGREELVKVLLEDNDPNVKDSLGRTALFISVQAENDLITKLLLDASIDVNCKDSLGETALHIAVEHGSESSTLLLLKYGADVNA